MLAIAASCFSMWVFLLLQNVVGFFAAFVFAVIFIALGFDAKGLSEKYCRWRILIKNMRYTRSYSSRLRITKMTNDVIVSLARPATNHRMLAMIQRAISKNLAFLVGASGKTASPKTLALQSVSYAVFLLFVTVPLSIALGIVFDRLFFVLAPMPVIIIFLPSIRLRLSGSERKSAVEDEIAFFSVYASIMQTVGKTLYTSMLQVIGTGVFAVIENDARMLRRNVALFGMDQSSALNSLAISHPNTQLRNLLLGYVSIQKSGGDLGLYMERKSEEFLNDRKFRFFKYASSAETIGEATLVLLSILPLLLVMSSFLLGPDSLGVVTSLSFVVIPTLTAALITIINSIQPKTHDSIGFGWFSPIVGAISGTVGFFIVRETWLALAVASFCAAIANFFFLSRQFAEISMAQGALTDFFRDVTEYRKIGIAIPIAIMRISRERTYNKFFDNVLQEISSKISYGMNLATIIDSLRIRSWHARVSFFILAKITESGGGTPQILEQMTDFYTKITQAKNEMFGRVRIFVFLAYTSPLLMVWSGQGMNDLLGRITPEYARLVNGAELGLVPSAEFLQMVNLLMIVSSLCMGMIMAKITHFTAKHTLTIAVTSAVAILSVYLVPFFPKF
ncbi:MAG: type II secretion system F family protein [Candidatus Nitrosotenuis sp.]